MLALLFRQAKRHREGLLGLVTLVCVFYFLKSIKGPGELRRERLNSPEETPQPQPKVADRVLPEDWYVIPNTPGSCDPKHDLYFVRTHQTGTSSVGNIFYRYGQEHELNFVMYPLKLHLDYPGRMKVHYLESLKPERGWNILAQYTRHHIKDVARVMPHGTIYTTLLRNPVDQFLSVFHNFEIKQEIRNLQLHQNPYEEFFRDPQKITQLSSDTVFHLLQNSMSFDLGLNTPLFSDPQAVEGFIESLDAEFHLVLILELLDEGLVLFKRLMCWSLEDIIYVKLSVNNEYSLSISDEIRQKILAWNSVDNKLYQHFYNKMKDIISKQDETFHEEVKQLKQLNVDFMKECYERTQPVYNGNKLGFVLNEASKDMMRCKVMATDDVTQTHIISLKQFRDRMSPSDVMMVRNHMSNLKNYNPAMLEWSDVNKVLHPKQEKPKPEL